MNFSERKSALTFIFFSLLVLGSLGWTSYVTGGHAEHGPVICIFKKISGFPCPTCGVIRSATAILHGDIWRGFLLNPLGFFLLLALVCLPLWSILDLFRYDSSLQRFIKKADKRILRWYYIGPLIILSVSNWLWNISKGL